MDKDKTVIILTGCSGSGKSTALATFEDAGFFCVDNMPVEVAAHFLKQTDQDPEAVAGWAFVMDMRDAEFLNGIEGLRKELIQAGFQVHIVFLDTDEQTLLRRYSHTRRRHPLGRQGSLVEAIRDEKRAMDPLRKKASHVIDTSHLTVHELKFAVLNIAQTYTTISGMAINIVTFGFKYGTPPGVDLIIDVRFLVNPFFVPELKAKDGESDAIRAFVLKDPQTSLFLEKYLDLIDFLIPLYEKEGKAYLTIAIGCTGGRHRSVVIAGRIYDHIRKNQSNVRLIHRDIGQG